MDFYIIELQDRLKIGISENVPQRINNLKNQAGINKKEILNLFHFVNCAIFEARLKRLFEPYKASGEWFYKKGLVELFINEIRNGENLSLELINKIQYENVYVERDLKKTAIIIYEKIKSERKSIGFPNSVTFETMMRTKKMRYRNMVYDISTDFTCFTREPNFSLENIKNSESIECLRIIKNNADSLEEKIKLQGYIDDIFNKKDSRKEEIIKIIGTFFFNITEFQRQENPNIRIEYDEEIKYYCLINDYKNLNSNEYALLKSAEKIEILSESITFNYRQSTCFCFFEEDDYPRILNFFKNKKIEFNYYKEIRNN
jgi:hypothetical protein